MVEVDIKRPGSLDLSIQASWDQVHRELDDGKWDVVIMSPPGSTWSRARYNSSADGGGPKPLRNSVHPWGFPWLEGAAKQSAQLGNCFFIVQCMTLIEKLLKLERCFIFEHPEDLGRTRSWEHPASVWQLLRMRRILDAKGVKSWAVLQCDFGASAPAPTRFVSNLPKVSEIQHKPPTFTATGFYKGPLSKCSHDWHSPLVGWAGHSFRTSSVEIFPDLLCKYLSSFVMSFVHGTDDLQSREFPSAEALGAHLLLHKANITRADACALVPLLPKESSHPATGQVPESSFFSGAFCKGGLQGLRQSCAECPSAVKVFTHLLRQAFPDSVFSSLAVFVNVKAAPHKDVNNAAYANLLLPLSDFKNGQVRQEDPQGRVFRRIQGRLLPGVLLPVADKPCKLDARSCFHMTEAWQGDRILLVGFTARMIETLLPAQRDQLVQLGFSLPPRGAQGGDSQDGKLGEGDTKDPGDSGVVQVEESDPEAALSSDTGEQDDSLFDPKTSRCFGQPLHCKHSTVFREFVDGFGLCSPGRWRPEQRGQLCGWQELDHAERLQRLVRNFVIEELGDLKRKAFELAAGKISSSPFSQPGMHRLRTKVAELLPDPRLAMEVPGRQPFFLNMLAQSLMLLGDPDAEILTEGDECYAKGMPLGYDRELPRTPQVFRERLHFRKLDQSPFQAEMANYTSAEMSAERAFSRGGARGSYDPFLRGFSREGVRG